MRARDVLLGPMLLCVALLGALACTGCGSSGGSASAPRTGALQIRVVWPPETLARVIPTNTHKIVVVVSGVGLDQPVSDEIIRPADTVTIRGLPLGGKTVRADARSEADEVLAVGTGTAQIQNAVTATVDIELLVGISGTVTHEEDGSPFFGVTVAAVVDATVVESVHTDADGRYAITGLSGDATSYRVVPSRPGVAFEPPFATVTVPPMASGVDFVGGPATYEIGGTVYDTDDATALEGAQVTLRKGVDQLAQQTTGADGAFLFSGLEAGEYFVWTSKAGLDFTPNPATERVGPSETELRIVALAPQQYSIRGAVTHAGGAPFPGVTVTLSDDSVPLETRQTDDTGAYTFDSLLAGQYHVRASYAATEFTPSVILVIITTHDVVGVNFQEGDGAGAGRIVGQVTDSVTGQPIAGALVSLFDSNNNFVQETISDTDGSYEFSNVTPGTYTIVAYRDEYEVLTVPNVVVPSA